MTSEPSEERERLLRELDPDERELVECCLRDHPLLTAAKCIEMLRAFGM